MKVLFLTQFYWPEARTAPTNLAAIAEDLQSHGHEVLVVTGVPNHPLGRLYDGYKMRLWQWEVVRGVRVLRLPLFPYHGLSAWRRMLNYGSFALSASTLGLCLSRSFKADVVFVYFAPLSIVGPTVLFRRLHRAPVVYWITDLWPENLSAAGIRMGKRLYQAIRHVESWAYRQAAAIYVASPAFKGNLIAKGVPAERVIAIGDWADESLFFPVEPDHDLAQRFGLADKFNVIYGGNLGTVQHLSTVVEAARSVQDLEAVQFVFIGDGSDAENLERQVAEYGLSNVRFIPRQPMDEIHRFFALADALLVHLKRESIFELQLPSKVLAYLACGRPILCAVPGAVETIVREAGAGVFCPAEDPEAMAEQVRLLYAMPRPERERMGQRGRQAYLANYTRSVQVNRVEKVLDHVAGIG